MSLSRILGSAPTWLSDGETLKGAGSLLLGWGAGLVTAWWKGRERYQAHISWQSVETRYGPDMMPAIVVQSVHTLPINVTRVRVFNGYRWPTGAWPFDSEDPEYPSLPRPIEPMKHTLLYLDQSALQRAAAQSRFLKWTGLPRVYLGVTTMGRNERVFVAEGGLPYSERRKRYR